MLDILHNRENYPVKLLLRVACPPPYPAKIARSSNKSALIFDTERRERTLHIRVVRERVHECAPPKPSSTEAFAPPNISGRHFLYLEIASGLQFPSIILIEARTCCDVDATLVSKTDFYHCSQSWLSSNHKRRKQCYQRRNEVYKDWDGEFIYSTHVSQFNDK